MKRHTRLFLGLLLVMLAFHGWLSVGVHAGDAAPPREETPVPPVSQPGVIGSGLTTVLPSGATVAVIPIEGLIYDFTLESLKRRADRAQREGATLIVIELDTPGGVVTSALDISTAIKNLPVPTVAWVNPKAYSAGIMIASACNAIVMAPASATGDCAPIVPGASLAPTERAKALSPILAEFRDNARRNNYDYAIFHAMCELGVEVYKVEHTTTGETRLVNQGDYQIMVQGATADSVRSAARARAQGIIASSPPPQPQPQQPAPVLPAIPGLPGSNTPQPQPGSTVFSIEELGGFMPETATDADRGAWKLVKVVHDGKSLLTVHQNEALDIGLAKSIVRNDAELQQFLSSNPVIRYSQTWSEDLAGWLTHPAVRAVLILLLLLGAYLEFQSPGVGLPGAVAALALIILIVSPFVIGLAEIWHLIMFAVGVGLLVYELITPGFAVFGISGIILIIAGLVLAVVPTSGQGPVPMPAPEMISRLQDSFIWTTIALIAALPGFWFITKHFGSIPVLNRLVLNETLPAANDPAYAHERVSGAEALGAGTIQTGDTGRALTELRPSGRAQIKNMAIDVVTSGAWIGQGTSVRVIEIEGNRIVVEAIRA